MKAAFLPPEVDRFPADSGCAVSRSCLRCPLPFCRFDVPLSVQRMEKAIATTAALKRKGLTPMAIAAEMGVSVRTVHRRFEAAR